MLGSTARKVKPLIEKAIISSRCDLRNSERLFLLVLNNVGCFARLKTIAERAGYTVRTAERARKALLERGIIKLLGRSIYCLETVGRWCKAFLRGESVKRCRVSPRACARKEVNTPDSTKKLSRNINRDVDAFENLEGDEREYVEKIRKYFRERKHTKYSWAGYDTETAREWYQRGVPLEIAYRAMDYGIANKLQDSLKSGRINSLGYFSVNVMEFSRLDVLSRDLGGGHRFEFELFLDKELKRRYELEEDSTGFTYAYGVAA